MNKAYLLVGVIIVSILTFAVINLINNYSSGSELDYYLLKETTQASMIDAIDSTYDVERGVRRLDKEKFVENFILRFATNVDNSRDYEISFYDINEVPPKVTIQVNSLNQSLTPDGESNAVISTKIEGILETNYKNDPVVATKYKKVTQMREKYDGYGNLKDSKTITNEDYYDYIDGREVGHTSVTS